MEEKIKEKLTIAFNPEKLILVNQSHLHANHAAMQERDKEKRADTHFKVLIVSAKFTSLTKVARHRWVYQVLQDELKGDMHALSVAAYSPEEYKKEHPSFA